MTLSRLVSSSSFLFRFCRQCASLYKYIRIRARARARVSANTLRLSPRVKQSSEGLFRPVLSRSLPTSRVPLCSAFVFVPLAFAPRLLCALRARDPGGIFPVDIFLVGMRSRYVREALRSRRNARDVLYRFHTCAQEDSSVGNSRSPRIISQSRSLEGSLIRLNTLAILPFTQN